MNTLTYSNAKLRNDDRVIYAITVKDVLDIAEEIGLDTQFVEEHLEDIYNHIESGFCHWSEIIETALDLVG